MKYILKNVLFGGETPINKVEPKIINSAILDENGVILQDATYDEGGYDTDLELPTIAEGDEAYYVTATLFIGEETNTIPDFKMVVKIVSLNSMTGFEVDSQRDNFLIDFMAGLNLVSVTNNSTSRVINDKSNKVDDTIVEKTVVIDNVEYKLVENKLSFWQRFLKLFK